MFEIGNSLREARMRQGLDYSQVELATKIRAKYIRALEEEEFAVLPSGTYIKGFMRSYAEFLGLDGQLYVDEYNSRHVLEGFDDMPQRRPGSRQDRSIERKVVVIALAGIAAVTALVIAAWKFGGSNSPNATPPPVSEAAHHAVRPQLRRARAGDVPHRLEAALGREAGVAGDAARRRPRVPDREALLALRAPSRPRPREARRQARHAPGAAQRARRRSGQARLSRPRAVIVVTGSELVRGDRSDLNGPFLAREAMRLGLDPVRIAIVGDDPVELGVVLRSALADGDAVITSGGLGPTHDDRTVEMVAQAIGVGLRVDPELEAQIEAVSRAAAIRLQREYADFEPGVRKQATMPDGARAIGLAGTAPGLIVPWRDGRFVVVLPGPPSELQRLWPNALETDEFRALLARTQRAGATRAPLLRRQRVGGRACARRRGGRGRRRRGDDLRPRLRDPRRPRRAA